MDTMTFIALPERERDKLWNKAQDRLTDFEVVFNDADCPQELRIFTDIVHLGEMIGEMATTAKEAAMLVEHIAYLLTPIADAAWACKEAHRKLAEISEKYKRLSKK